MKKIRILSILLFSVLLFILCMGGRKEYRISEWQGKISAPLEQEDITVLHMQQEQDDLSIELNRAVFEDNLVILDYIMRASDLSKYEDVFPKFWKGDIEGHGGGATVEEKPGEKRLVAYLELEGGTFSEADEGEEVELVFESFYGAGMTEIGSGIKMVFPVTIEKVYHPNIIEIGQKFPCEGGAAVVKSIEVSRFRTDVHFIDKTEDTSFMMNLYFWEITDESGEALQCLGGSDGIYNYTALPEGCNEIGLTLIKYRKGKKDLSYDKIGETVKIPIH